MVLGCNPVKLKALQLAPKPRVAGLSLSLTQLCHHGQGFEILLKGVAERDLSEPLVDLRHGLGQLGPVRGDDLNHHFLALALSAKVARSRLFSSRSRCRP